MSLFGLHYPGVLSDGLEWKLGPWDGDVEITELAPFVVVPPSGGPLVLRIQNETGASPGQYLEATMADGDDLLTAPASGSVAIAEGSEAYVRVVSSNGAQILGGYMEVTR